MRKGGGMTDDYEPASVEESLAAARGILARLFELPLLSVAGEGECDDCQQSDMLFEFGRLRVCRSCATSRQRARKMLADEVEEIRKAEAS
jgi:hypothetical protein